MKPEIVVATVLENVAGRLKSAAGHVSRLKALGQSPTRTQEDLLRIGEVAGALAGDPEAAVVALDAEVAALAGPVKAAPVWLRNSPQSPRRSRMQRGRTMNLLADHVHGFTATRDFPRWVGGKPAFMPRRGRGVVRVAVAAVVAMAAVWIGM
jgi:hypothetical protein